MKLYLTQGAAYTIKNGERVSVTEIEAQDPSTCSGCKLNCCTNKLEMKANNTANSTTYPATTEVVVTGSTVKLRVTIDLGAGPIVKEVTLT